MAEEYYQISQSLSGIDFYTAAPSTSASVLIDLTVPNVNVSKIAYASSSIEIDTIQVTVAIEILNTNAFASIETNLTAQTSKIAFASSIINIDTNLACLMYKTTFGISNIDSNLSTDALLIAIRTTDVDTISINTDLAAILKEILSAESSINILSAILLNPPIKFTPGLVDSSSIRTLLMIDDKPITNHNRNIDISLTPIFIENRNWNNKSRRYYKRSASSGKSTFSLSWNFLPNYREKTVDQRYARDYLLELAEDNDIHTLKIINQDEDGVTPYTETTYNVFIKSYSESLIRRDLIDGVYYFDCNLTLEEA